MCVRDCSLPNNDSTSTKVEKKLTDTANHEDQEIPASGANHLVQVIPRNQDEKDDKQDGGREGRRIPVELEVDFPMTGHAVELLFSSLFSVWMSQ